MLFILIAFIAIDGGSPLFIQVRVGMDQKPFKLVKLRTMKLNTVSMATHLVEASAVTRLGSFLRRSKLDELPQLWNVVKGEMSLVGPRPCLFNQTELIEARRELHVFNVRPGITGLSQIKGIDMSSPLLLAQIDSKMIQNMSISAYFYYLFKTIGGAGQGDRVK